MPRSGRTLVAGVAAAAAVLLLAAAPSYAGGGLQKCLDQAGDHNGEPPTCTQTASGTWVASWPDDGGLGGSGGGVPGAFVALFVLGLIAAVGLTVWKVTTAQKLARQSGMDPGLATRMTLLSDDGLDATYLASSLRQSPQPTPAAPAGAPPTASPPSATSRLEELKGLLDRGLVTQVEYDERRKAIIDSV
jgi:hypothetical protein